MPILLGKTKSRILLLIESLYQFQKLLYRLRIEYAYIMNCNFDLKTSVACF